jgi:hypothetical protein
LLRAVCSIDLRGDPAAPRKADQAISSIASIGYALDATTRVERVEKIGHQKSAS